MRIGVLSNSCASNDPQHGHSLCDSTRHRAFLTDVLFIGCLSQCTAFAKMLEAITPEGTHLNPAFEMPFGTHHLLAIILTLLTLAFMHIIPPTIDCFCIILMIVVATNWARSRLFPVGHLPLAAWVQSEHLVGFLYLTRSLAHSDASKISSESANAVCWTFENAFTPRSHDGE